MNDDRLWEDTMAPTTIRLAAALALAFSAGAARAQDAALPVTIALSSNSLAYGGLRIAEQLGLFTKDGLAPRIVVLDSGSAATAALVSNSADFASSGPAEVLAARARGLDIRIVNSVYHGFAAPIVLAASVAAKLAVTPSSPLAERYKALDGLAIAAPSATSALVAPVRGAAEQAGAKIRLVYMAQPSMIPALQTGAIQGYIASSPYWSASVLDKAGVMWINAARGELPAAFQPSSSAVLEVMGSTVEANKEKTARLRRVFTDVAERIKSDPAAAFAALQRAYPQTNAETLKLVFDQDASNWSAPNLDEADMKQELALFKNATNLPGLDTLPTGDILLK